MERKTKTVKRAKKHGSERAELFALLFEMGRLMKSEIHRDNRPLPSFLHAETLRFIHEAGNPTMRDIAEYLKVTPPTATALVDTFVAEKLLDRAADADDRRKVRLALSKKGKTMLADLKRRREDAFARVFDSLSDEDCREFARILTIITRSPAARAMTAKQ